MPLYSFVLFVCLLALVPLSRAWLALPSSPKSNHHRQFFPSILPDSCAPTCSTNTCSTNSCSTNTCSTNNCSTNNNSCCAKCQGALHGQVIETHDHGDRYYHAACFTCHECHETIQGPFHASIIPGIQSQLSAEALFHPNCYKKRMGLHCDYCGHLLEQEWTQHDGRKYHPSCYTHFVQVKCVVCNQGMEGAWTITDPFGNVAHAQHHHHHHPHHPHDTTTTTTTPTATCASCQRILTQHDNPLPQQLRDGRVICGYCAATAVTTSAQISVALQDVMQQLQAVLGGVQGVNSINDNDDDNHHQQQHQQQQQTTTTNHNGWQGQIHIHLADRQALAQQAQQAGCLAHSHGNSNFHGLTTTTRITTALATLPQTFTTMEHEIVLLRSLPELQFRGVLAHELLHVWLNEAGLSPAHAPQLVEGFCNLGSWLIYKREAARHEARPQALQRHSPLARHPHTRKEQTNAALANVLLQQLQQDPDVVYGDGYRTMRQILQQQGWHGVLTKLAQASAGDGHTRR